LGNNYLILDTFISESLRSKVSQKKVAIFVTYILP